MDYISRENIKNIFNEGCKKKCIHPEALFCNGCLVNDIFRIIEKFPSADVEEVIRCKDCKYFNLNKWGKVNDIPLIVAHEICDF